MSITNEKEVNANVIKHIAEKMLVAARTAPKARGADNLEIAFVEGEKIKALSNKMRDIGEKANIPFFIRDSINIKEAPVVVLIGTKFKSTGLQDVCGFCGYKNCDEKDKHPEHPCIYNTNDMGIAIGSAVSIATDNRIDNRVMFSVGKAALELGFFSKEVKIILGIPLSAKGKNPFFDRT